MNTETKQRIEKIKRLYLVAGILEFEIELQDDIRFLIEIIEEREEKS